LKTVIDPKLVTIEQEIKWLELDETMDAGCETGSMVSEDYTATICKFNDIIVWVQLDQGVDDFDNLISPEESWHVEMTWQ
jgi:hypothetical protein